MKIIKAENYDEMSVFAAQYIMKRMNSKAIRTLGLATGSTPKGVYAQLINHFQSNQLTFQHISTFNLDEYVGLHPSDFNSYHYYMMSHLFDAIDIPKSQTHLPNGMAKDLTKECEHYEKQIDNLGGIDIQLLGIGHNGHIGFNEPGSSFNSRTRIIKLTDSTRSSNAKFFPSIDEVPTHAITMGIATILECKEIVLLASGTSKASVMEKLINGKPSEQLPASALKLHQHVTIIADRDALALVNE
ncbi:glucosamine-6-phosphate deaminase [Niallia oryzisoli]|uniref:glucosamine-6-phosphate deaminase n=1 Tax=Niallia oryzisoli TaxID=1737571 RepID=UPI003735833D